MADIYSSPNTAIFNLNRVYVVLLVIGAGLRIWQYTADTSLYIDEVAVARHILDRSLPTLLTVALPDQSAPKGFLLALKISVLALGSNDLTLRLFSLVTSLGSLVLFWRIAVRLRGAAGPMAFTLFAGAIPLITFGSEVKQYSGDVFFTLLMLWLTLRIVASARVSPGTLWATGLAGALAAWFSHPAALVLFSLAIVLVFAPAMHGKRWQLAPMLGLWIASALAATVEAMWSLPPNVRVNARQIWTQGFLPLPLTKAFAMLWPWDQIKAILGRGIPASLAYPEPALYFVLIVVGFGVLLRRQRTLAVCLLAPIAATLGAAVARQYPFADRLILFLIPMFLLALGAGIEKFREWVARGSHRLWSTTIPGWLVYVTLGGMALWPVIKTPPPYHVEDMKLVLAYLQAERLPTDRIYTYYAAAPATAYYAARYGLHDEDYAVGGCHRGDGRRYLDEIDKFRGSQRVWVLLTHSLPAFQEREDILHYLDTIGIRQRSFSVSALTFGNRGFPAEVYLYDLSNSAKLAQAAAISFPIVSPISPEARSRCSYGPHIMIAPRGL